MNNKCLFSSLLCFLLLTTNACFAKDNTQKPLSKSPVMVGVPPSTDSQVTLKNYSTYPYGKWAFHNVGAPLSTLTIARQGAVRELNNVIDNKIADLEFIDGFGQLNTVENVLKNNDTDAFVVLQGNDVMFERYYNQMNRHEQHIWFSATKSLVSSALGILVDQGKIDIHESPVKYIPELKDSGFARTTIQNILNHSSAIDFKENYTDPDSDFWKLYAPALNMGYIPGGRDIQPKDTDIYGVHDFLSRFIKEDKSLKPGDVFDYNSTNADVIGWLIAHVSGMPLHDFIERHIWSKLGAEHDALIVADRAYMPVATGGMTTTARDAALFTQMILNRGKIGEQQVIPASWVDATLDISDKDLDKMRANKSYSSNSWTAYHNMWWLLDADKGEYAASGIYGQVLYINRAANTVVVMYGSQKVASAAGNKHYASKLQAAQAIAEYLSNK